MALNTGIRSVSRIIASSESSVSRSVSRSFHSTGTKKMSGGGHGHDDYEYYLHAKHMYNLDRMKYQALKMSLGVFTAFSIGVGVPIFAVVFQQRKTASG
uniref:SLL1 protein n=2 Tax=Noccaea caerulescens TaxID=107243 RepID=A0A1J3IK46_NOCCA